MVLDGVSGGSVVEGGDGDANLLLLVTLVEEFFRDGVSPVQALVPGPGRVGNVYGVEDELEKQGAIGARPPERREKGGGREKEG